MTSKVKKFLSGLVLIEVLVILIVPALVLSQSSEPHNTPSPPHLPLTTAGIGNIRIESPIGTTTIPVLIERITNWVFYIGIILAPLMILVGAFYLVTAAGIPARIETGKKFIIWTIVGLAVIFLSRAIIGIIKYILGG